MELRSDCPVANVKSRTFDSVLCFGDSDWWYHNRGHADMQFMRRFARHWRVIYINSLGVRVPSMSEGRMFLRRVTRKCRSTARYYRDGGEGFSVLSPIFLPFHDGLLGRSAIRGLELQIKAVARFSGMQRPLLWVACPTAARVLDRIRRVGIVYQLSDCYVSFNGTAGAAAQMERTLARSADLVLCSSRRLHDRARQLYGTGEYVEHGVDFELFDAALRNPRVPAELRGAGRPIIGFFGNMDANTVDRLLLDWVIQSRPRYTFVLVGPMASDFEMLRCHKNVIAVPQTPYHKIAHYGAAFDVCLMPWLQNEWIEHCNPVKFKEYLALGKPVVSTPFPELRQCPSLCYVASGAEAFASAIDRALEEDSPTMREQRRTWAAQHTWDAKFAQVLDLLETRGIRTSGRTLRAD